MYSGIEIPIRREQANRSPASPSDSRRLQPTGAGARQRTEALWSKDRRPARSAAGRAGPNSGGRGKVVGASL